MSKKRNVRRPFALLVFIGLAGLVTLPDFPWPAAHAAGTFVVNPTGDGADGDLGDGVCNDGSGNYSLRAAFQRLAGGGHRLAVAFAPQSRLACLNASATGSASSASLNSILKKVC